MGIFKKKSGGPTTAPIKSILPIKNSEKHEIPCAPSLLHELELPYEDAVTGQHDEYRGWLGKSVKESNVPPLINSTVESSNILDLTIKDAIYRYRFQIENPSDEEDSDDKCSMEVHIL